MVGWHHRLDGQEFEQAQGVGDGQGSLACCSLWGGKVSDTTERLKDDITSFPKNPRAAAPSLSAHCPPENVVC